MDESNILSKQIIEKAVNEAVSTVKKFTKKELKQLILSYKSKDKPLIIPINDLGFIIGKYAIKPHKSFWILAPVFNLEHELEFSTKTTAILYAFCQNAKNYKLADSIYIHDSSVSRLTEEVAMFSSRSRRALKRNNKFDYIRFVARLTEVQYLLNYNHTLLTKSLKMAKYNYL